MDDLIRRLTTRRNLLTGATAFALTACASGKSNEPPPRDAYPADEPVTSEYRQDEITDSVANFFGVTAKASAEVVERVFGDLGRPNAYIQGEEAAAAVVAGLRYGEGWLYRRQQEPIKIYWTGPSVGFDLGVNASKCFTLIYNLQRVSEMFQRFPGVDGSYYFIAGIGVNYLRDSGITLAPMRSGAGLRAGLNVGYLSFTEEREWVPL